jgi:hypothetical protein
MLRSARALRLCHEGAASRRDEPTLPESATVRFVVGNRPLVSVLEVLAPSDWDVVADVYRTLYDLRVQVIHASARRGQDTPSLCYRLQLVEFDGGQLDRGRHREVLIAVEDRLLDLDANRAPAPSVVRARGMRVDRAKVDAESRTEVA